MCKAPPRGTPVIITWPDRPSQRGIYQHAGASGAHWVSAGKSSAGWWVDLSQLEEVEP